MGEVVPYNRHLHLEATHLGKPSGAPLPGGGGGGISGGMEARVSVLESHLGEIKSDVRELRSDVGLIKTGLATLTERADHLPSKGYIVKAVTSMAAVLAALIMALGALNLFGAAIRHAIGLH